MNLYLISQTENGGYDTFDSAVVVAKNEEAARHVHPQTSWLSGSSEQHWDKGTYSWANTPEEVTAQLIGRASEDQQPDTVICASFNAG